MKVNKPRKIHRETRDTKLQHLTESTDYCSVDSNLVTVNYRGKPIPVFLVGLQRTGTSLLGDVIAVHPGVAAVKGVKIKESNFFSVFCPRGFGDLKSEENYVKLRNLFLKTLFFRVSNLDKQIYYENRPTNYPDFFRLMMDKLASRKKATHWIDKSPHHSPYLKEIAQGFPEAKFIAIKRDVVETIRSAMKKLAKRKGLRKNLFRLARLTFAYASCYKHIQSANLGGQILMIRFEELLSSPKEVLSKICNFLGLPFSKLMLEELAHNPNPSFSTEGEKKHFFSRGERLFIKGTAAVLGLIPSPIYRILHKLRLHRGYQRNVLEYIKRETLSVEENRF